MALRAGARFVVRFAAFLAGARFFVALRAGARFTAFFAGARFLVALRAGARLAAFLAGSSSQPSSLEPASWSPCVPEPALRPSLPGSSSQPSWLWFA